MDINPSAIKESLIIQRYFEYPGTNKLGFLFIICSMLGKRSKRYSLQKKWFEKNCDESHGIPIRKKITV